MRYVAPVLFGVCVGLFLLFAQRWAVRRASARNDRKAAEGRSRVAVHDECLTAEHEAGHALAAWACFLVDRIVVASIDGSPHVTHRFWLPRFKGDQEWCDMVISLAGIAAELMVNSRARTGGSASDIVAARASATWIIEHKATVPWDAVDVKSLPFAHLFDPPLSSEERACLETGFSKARQLLRDGADRHARMVSALLCHRRMTYEDILAVLGNRHWMRAKVIGAAFNRPEAMKAGFVEIARDAA